VAPLFGVPAEVESILVKNQSIVESAAIDVPDEVKGEALVCFVILGPHVTAGEQLREELKKQVVEDLGKPLTLKAIYFVRDLPRTRNAKIMGRVIRAVYIGKDPGGTSSLESLAAVDEIRKMSKVSFD
jgi:acetyl-CoA synthetase